MALMNPDGTWGPSPQQIQSGQLPAGWSQGGGLAGAFDGAKDWLLGGSKTNNLPTGPASGAFQTSYLKDLLNRQAPQMDTGQYNQTRGQEGQLAGMLFSQANGQTPGAGEMAVNRQVNNAQANQTATAQMARGANAALAGRTAARMNADLGVNGAGQAAQAQMQDQTNARSQLGGLLNNMGGQAIQVAGANQQGQLAQQQAQLQGLAQMLGVDQATLNAALSKAQAQMQDKGMLGSLLQVGGQLGAAALGRASPAAAMGGGSTPTEATYLPNGNVGI